MRRKSKMAGGKVPPTAFRCAVVTIVLLIAATFSPSAVANGSVQPRFDLTDPSGGPFPSDRFTVPDTTQLTGLRVNLPPPDCALRPPSDCDDIDVLNTLDGFNLQPRLSIPFMGPIDPATVSSETLFLFKLSCLIRTCPGDSRVGINQVVWDPATNTLYAESDQLLDQDARYLLVVTRSVLDANGKHVKAAKEFLDLVDNVDGASTGDPALDAYRTSLRDALTQIDEAGIVALDQVVAASIFTTQSATAVLEKIRDQIHAATPDPADFAIGTNGERTVFPLADVTSIAFRRQTGTAPTFTPPNPVSLDALQIVPGAVGTIAFGRYSSPDYQVHLGEFIPPVGTLTGSPAVQSTNFIYFNVYLPSGSQPAQGWPVVIEGHGFGAGSMLNARLTAAKLAQHGMATIGITFVGHGGGPLGTLAVTKADLSTITLPFGGRGIDQDGFGRIDLGEGFFAAFNRPQAIVFARDGVRQTVVDLMQLVREIQVGIDVNGDSAPDLDSSRVYYHGGSLGGIVGTDFVALEPSVRAGALGFAGGSFAEIGRLSAALRPTLGQLLDKHVPSLLNGGPDPIDFPGNPSPYPASPWPFRDNLPPFCDEPCVNSVPGAIAIQEEIERIEWAAEAGDPVAYASHLRKDPLAGNQAKPVLYRFATGDESVPNPTTSALLRAGDLADRATLFRNDLAYAAYDPPLFPRDPHGVLGAPSSSDPAPVAAVKLAAQEQVDTFLASDGQVTIDPDGACDRDTGNGCLFETPIVGPLPEALCFIGFQLPCP